jgi:uncharacterized protein (TIGR00730 family)
VNESGPRESRTRARSVAVFCGANRGASPRFAALARAMGEALGRRGIGLVYGGGNVGLMGVLADGALTRGGRVIGVIPRLLAESELAHRGATEMHVVESMHDRKALMTARCDAFVALPGGLGTMDELFEALTWAQLGIHRKPIYLLDPFGYYEPLVAQIDRFVAEGFLTTVNRNLLSVCTLVGELFEAIDPPAVDREVVFHLTSHRAWSAAVEQGAYRGDTLASEGFIHCSRHRQVAEVANRLFRGRDDLVLLAVDAGRLASRVVYENLEGGEMPYPHVYGPIDLDAVVRVASYAPDRDGRFAAPAALGSEAVAR